MGFGFGFTESASKKENADMAGVLDNGAGCRRAET
mgnify:CR=1 FL=1